MVHSDLWRPYVPCVPFIIGSFLLLVPLILLFPWLINLFTTEQDELEEETGSNAEWQCNLGHRRPDWALLTDSEGRRTISTVACCRFYMQFLRNYKEIWFGIGLGLLAWLTDAVMHVELGGEVHSGGLFNEIFAPHPTALVFRVFYLIIAVAFGFFLWRVNWRERQLRTLERSVIAFQRQLDAPALRILSMTGQLRNRNSVRLDETADQIAGRIAADAALIDELAKRYLEFSRLVQEGETVRAIETLRSIESWLAERNLTAKL